MENLEQKIQILKETISNRIYDNYLMGFRKYMLENNIDKLEEVYMDFFKQNCNKNMIITKLEELDILSLLNKENLINFTNNKEDLLNKVSRMSLFNPHDSNSILGKLSENITNDISNKLYKEDENKKEKSNIIRKKLEQKFEESGLSASYESKRESLVVLDEKERELQINNTEEKKSNYADMFK